MKIMSASFFRLRLYTCGVIALLACACPGELPAASLPTGFSEATISAPSGGWNEPVGIAFDQVQRMYVWERAGRVWIREPGATTWSLLINISEEVGSWSDYGMLGFALDPNFRVNGYIYLMYVVDRHHLMNFGTGSYSPTANQYFDATIGRITRYTARASDGFRSVDLASRRVLLGETRQTGIPILHHSHGVGSLVFGTDGTLLASCGDGASFGSVDVGSASETFYQQGLADGIIRPEENVGSYRSQMVNSLNGKVLRIDPATGDGIPSNPFYDAANPRAPRSRVWALGLRNPFRMTLRPESGSHFPSDGRPGVLNIGDVGYGTWEELNVCDGPGQSFGWPLFEGIELHSQYNTSSPANRDAPNPLFPASGCNQYFNFRDLTKQKTSVAANQPPFNNPCNTSQKIPASIPQFLQKPPEVDWRHASVQARTWIYNGSGVATAINIDATGSPVSGSMFAGNCSVGGAWYLDDVFPAQYRNTFFGADYGQGWIKSFTFDSNMRLSSVANFAANGGEVVGVFADPVNGGLYYITDTVRRISYSASGNLPPTAVASADRRFGPSPLAVIFTGSGSTDPEGLALSYNWNFGDGTPNSNAANPSHTFNAPAGVPTLYTVTLTVTDSAGQTSVAQVTISVNNTPPSVAITSPADRSLYPMDSSSVYTLIANVSDAEFANSSLRYEWRKFLHHNDHAHQDPVDTNQVATTVVSPIGCDGINIYYYRVELTVIDPAGLSAKSEVKLFPDCGSPDTPPVISDIPNQTTPSGVAVGPIPFTVGDAETAPGNLQLSVSSSNPSLVPTGNMVLGGEGANRTLLVTPASGQGGSATITVTVNDGPSDVSDSFVLTVTGGDATPPSVQITSPAGGALLSGNVTVTATASDNAGVAGVQFRVGSSNLGTEDSSAPYSQIWDTRAFANGAYVLTAVARDAAGNRATSGPVSVTVSNSITPPGSGLVAAFGFNEGSGTQAQDVSGNGHVGVISGATWVTTGRFGGALQFNGGSSWVTVADAASLDLASGMTLEAWVYPTALSGWRTVMLKEDSGGLAYALYAHDQVPRPAAYINTGGLDVSAAGTAGLALNTWTHLAATYDGTTLRIFVNGVQAGTRTVGGAMITSALPLRIGGNQVWGEYFSGFIDEIRIYNQPLTATQIQADMAAPVNPPPPADTTAPTAPGNLSAAGAYQRVTLNWTAATDDVGVTRYNVHRGSTTGFTPALANRIAQVTSLSYTNTGLAPGTYYYRVTAEDAAGNVSVPSEEAAGTALADIVPPSTQITAPADGATVSGTINVVATANDDVGVAGVQFQVGGVNLGSEDTSAPYSQAWDTRTVANGVHVLTAVARDGAGNQSTSAPVSVTVFNDLTAPTAPGGLSAAGAYQRVTLSWTASTDDVGVVRYNVHRGAAGFTPSLANRIAQVTSLGYTNTGLAPGTYYYRVTAEDAAGNVSVPSGEAAGTALGDVVPPSVQLTAPANGATVSGTITNVATANDDVGVAGVQFRVGAVNLGSEDTSAPYSQAWDTRTVTNGVYALRAIARDGAGNQATSAPVTVTVSNNVSSGLAAAYSLNQGSGTSATDSSGNNNSGTLNGATWTTAGRTASAVSFDGVNDRIDVNDSASLDLISGLTLEAWVYPTALSGWRTVILKERPGGLAYALYAHDNAPRPAAYIQIGTSEIAVTGSAALPLNTWTHLATTYDGANLRLYVNGAQVGSRALTGSIPASTAPLRMGGNAIWGEYFAGRIDEVRIYNRALSGAEIQADMGTPVP